MIIVEELLLKADFPSKRLSEAVVLMLCAPAAGSPRPACMLHTYSRQAMASYVVRRGVVAALGEAAQRQLLKRLAGLLGGKAMAVPATIVVLEGESPSFVICSLHTACLQGSKHPGPTPAVVRCVPCRM